MPVDIPTCCTCFLTLLCFTCRFAAIQVVSVPTLQWLWRLPRGPAPEICLQDGAGHATQEDAEGRWVSQADVQAVTVVRAPHRTAVISNNPDVCGVFYMFFFFFFALLVTAAELQGANHVSLDKSSIIKQFLLDAVAPAGCGTVARSSKLVAERDREASEA